MQTTASKELPSRPDLEWLRKAAKDLLASMRAVDHGARLFQAQLQLARDYGFQDWRELVRHVEETSVDGQILRATLDGRAVDLDRLLKQNPKKLQLVGGRNQRPLLHLAAALGYADCVAVLLACGFEVDTRDRLDNATALHWAAQEGRLEIVRQLLDAGADVNAAGDHHGLGVLGWAAVLAARYEVAELLLARGATPTLFSAVAMGREDIVSGFLDSDPTATDRRLGYHEHHQTPLHLAVARNRARIVGLLIEHGADVLVKDARGATPMQYIARSSDPSIKVLLVESGADSAGHATHFESATPQLEVKSVSKAMAYFVEKLGFEKEWEAGSPPNFGCVARDNVVIFLCAQNPSLGPSYVAIGVRDVDALFEEYQARGTKVLQPPTDQQWGGRSMTVEGPDGNIIGLSTIEAA
jgi:ankyrin repeat protein